MCGAPVWKKPNETENRHYTDPPSLIRQAAVDEQWDGCQIDADNCEAQQMPAQAHVTSSRPERLGLPSSPALLKLSSVYCALLSRWPSSKKHGMTSCKTMLPPRRPVQSFGSGHIRIFYWRMGGTWLTTWSQQTCLSLREQHLPGWVRSAETRKLISNAFFLLAKFFSESNLKLNLLRIF